MELERVLPWICLRVLGIAIVRWTHHMEETDQIEYEADPRHSDIYMARCKKQTEKGSTSGTNPGIKTTGAGWMVTSSEVLGVHHAESGCMRLDIAWCLCIKSSLTAQALIGMLTGDSEFHYVVTVTPSSLGAKVVVRDLGMGVEIWI